MSTTQFLVFPGDVNRDTQERELPTSSSFFFNPKVVVYSARCTHVVLRVPGIMNLTHRTGSNIQCDVRFNHEIMTGLIPNVSGEFWEQSAGSLCYIRTQVNTHTKIDLLP